MASDLVKRNGSTSVLVRMAAKFGLTEQALLDTVKKTCMPANAAVTNEQFAAFLLVAEEHDLNPLTKEIYAFPRPGGGIQHVVGVDGWYKIANAHPQYDGCSEEIVEHPGLGIGIRTTIYRKDQSHPTTHTAWLKECKRNTEPWKMEMRMLGHKSFIQCARRAFSYANFVDPDEAERIREIDAIVSEDAPKPADEVLLDMLSGGAESEDRALDDGAEAEIA